MLIIIGLRDTKITTSVTTRAATITDSTPAILTLS